MIRSVFQTRQIANLTAIRLQCRKSLGYSCNTIGTCLSLLLYVGLMRVVVHECVPVSLLFGVIFRIYIQKILLKIESNDDRSLSLLPMCHILETIINTYDYSKLK